LAEDVHRLVAASPDDVPRLLTEVAQGRRFLVRSHPTGAKLQLWWREDGFAIGPHD
jgi:hypothetical protein